MLKKKSIIISVIFTFALVAFLISYISLNDILTSLSKLSLSFVLLALFFYFLSYLFRTSRFLIFLNKDLSFKQVFPIVCVHNFMNNLLPARLGELSYFYILKKKNINFGKSFTSFAVVRFFDLFVVSLFLFLSLLFVKDIPNSLSPLVPFIATLIGLLLIFLLISPFLYRFFSDKIDGTKNIFFKKLREIYDSLFIIKSKLIIFKLFLFSILIWFSLYSLTYVLLIDLGINFSIWQSIIIISFPLIISALPLHGVGGYGTTEVAWLIPFLAFGLTKEFAIVNGFIIHTFQFSMVLLLGAVGYIIYKFKK